VSYMHLECQLKEINEGLVNYGKNLRLQGLQGNKSNTDLAKGDKRLS